MKLGVLLLRTAHLGELHVYTPPPSMHIHVKQQDKCLAESSTDNTNIIPLNAAYLLSLQLRSTILPM